jgi:hypothetical protein
MTRIMEWQNGIFRVTFICLKEQGPYWTENLKRFVQ